MDVISDVLRRLPVRGRTMGLLSLHGDWAFESPKNEEAVFHIVSEGSVFVTYKGQTTQLNKGDMILFKQGQAHVLGSDPDAPMVTFAEEDTRVRIHSVADGQVSDVAKRGEGPETSIICGRFNFGTPAASQLAGNVPEHMVLRRDEDTMSMLLDPLLRRIAIEAKVDSPGALAALDGLLNTLFLHFMRSWIVDVPDDRLGWVQGLKDPNVAKSLEMIHKVPDRKWSVRDLASEAGMSRSNFSMRFKELVGESPLQYLTRWRMTLACEDLVADPERPLSSIAASVGYDRESSFSTAFKRFFGTSPGALRKGVGNI
jgi:AraC-like DNA-binding protein